MNTVIALPLDPLKKLLHEGVAGDILKEIDGTLHLMILTTETIQHINDDTQAIRVCSILNPCEP